MADQKVKHRPRTPFLPDNPNTFMICPPLTYCTNVHAGETWEEIRNALHAHLPVIKSKAGCADQVFPIGLRLSAQAVEELLNHQNERHRFQDWMQENGFEVFTLNGFPYGAFHGTRVKENVFLPDWSTSERLHYTKQLFLLLDEWAPPERDISVSTLPASHKSFRRSNDDLLPVIREMGRFLEKLSSESGRDCHLGFEPEPFGHFDNTEESIAFLQQVFLGQPDENALRRRLGLTYDTCHFALQFESPEESFSALARADIRVSKIQASNALSLDPRQPGALEALGRYNEPVYFHQVVARETDGSIRVFPDMTPALEWAATTDDPGREWRCHFHIPIGANPVPPLGDTNDHLLQTIRYQQSHPEWTPHWEAETYTWSVLPDSLRTNLNDQIARELIWLRERFLENRES